MTQITDYVTPYKPTWCPGCGDFGIWASLRRAYVQLDLPAHKLLHVYDVGCSGNGSNWFRSYGFHSLHGRALPLAVGAKLGNHDLTVVAFAGDGGGYGEGGNHFIHTCRYNLDMTFVIHDNQLYSLTTGQASPTTDKGHETKTTPKGEIKHSLRPLQLAISSGATFVARGYSDDLKGLTELFAQAIQHKGFAVIDILQPCVTFNMINTREWYTKSMKKLDESYDSTNRDAALLKAGEWQNGIPMGIIYREERPTFESFQEGLQSDPLNKQVKKYSVESLIDEFR